MRRKSLVLFLLLFVSISQSTFCMKSLFRMKEKLPKLGLVLELPQNIIYDNKQEEFYSLFKRCKRNVKVIFASPPNEYFEQSRTFIAELLSQNHAIVIDLSFDNYETSQKIIQEVGQCKNLESLDLRCNSKLPDERFSLLKNLKKLKSLKLLGCDKLTEKCFETIACLTALQLLWIESDAIKNPDIKLLANLKFLREFILMNCE